MLMTSCALVVLPDTKYSPSLSMFLVNYDDWLHTVITHEYAHILHLDTASGLPLVLRRVFGRVPFVVFPFLTTLPNLWQPIWMIEGLATHEETELGTSDRRDNPFADMLLRMAVLEHDFPTIDQADGLTATTSLTARGGMILGPAVSPDGSTIAYTENSLDALPTLRAIRIDGTGDRAITRRTSRFPS